jgi:hypothetical protein
MRAVIEEIQSLLCIATALGVLAGAAAATIGWMLILWYAWRGPRH